MNAFLRKSICALLVLLHSSSLIDGALSGLNVGDVATSWQLSHIVFVSGQNKSCAGAIINENWIATTAQCVYDQSPSNVMVLAGTDRKDNASGTVFKVSEIVAHQEFTDHTFLVHDLALVKIDGAFEFGDLIKPIDRTYPTEDYGLVFAAGWTDSDVIYSTQLLMVDYDTCTQLLNEANVVYPRGPGQFCTAITNSPAFLSVSTGPLLRNDFLIGFYSYSVSDNNRLVNINTNAHYYEPWINYTITHY